MRRKALVLGEFMCALHPTDPFRHLNVDSCGNSLRRVVGGTLDIDDPGKYIGVVVEEPGSAVLAEMPSTMRR